MAQLDLFLSPKQPWNHRRLIGPKPPFKPKNVWGIRQQLKTTERVRDLALFFQLRDRCEASRMRSRKAADLRCCPGWIATCARHDHPAEDRPAGALWITEPTRDALAAWLQRRGRRTDDWLFRSRSRPGEHITTRQYARLVNHWVAMIDLEPCAYGTHSLRRTKVALIYKKTGNLRACQLLLGHRKLESTVRYLGIEVDDALEMSEQIDL